jgi:hypothetical protein
VTIKKMIINDILKYKAIKNKVYMVE